MTRIQRIYQTDTSEELQAQFDERTAAKSMGSTTAHGRGNSGPLRGGGRGNSGPLRGLGRNGPERGGGRSARSGHYATDSDDLDDYHASEAPLLQVP
jgi:hypothetical protein